MSQLFLSGMVVLCERALSYWDNMAFLWPPKIAFKNTFLEHGDQHMVLKNLCF